MPSSPVSRRNLLGAAAAAPLLAAPLLATPAAAAPDTAAGGHRLSRVPLDRISVQLYTLRDQLGLDLAASLAELRAIGYTRVEHAGFVGRTAAQFRAALDAAGLKATSGHVAVPQPWDASAWQRALDDANIVGNRFVVHPFFGIDASTGQPIRDGAKYHALARDLNRAGALAKRAGLDFGYHNHQLEFVRQDGGPRTGYDILTAETDPDLVHLEVDLFWAWRGTADPVDLIQRHRGRIRQVHVKDMDTAAAFSDPGAGLIDFGRIFQHAREAGLVEYIVERDDAGTPPRTPADALTTARNGYRYLADLRF
ncbi:sugar phosphate isomerase/epimerase [Dactylosporangium aurantiacum]|uniref:Sugar phosphate isomerase/epimerase n=1 Tax=Dactylosporangium aurantiacum TaxID=35754 RepID=A0A9Q9IKK8_9ACTN|nr:sugar phosphate isomerase/epimerase [Dactylosporangium aurantiacum]MDG6109962.1 sugar phosphate isomerase/epimerase [Dactylosporangium aurantiacum]UWZ57286.1 sugar phosphate isomerase/epimerase [Dactylosporangium aurantiacum]